MAATRSRPLALLGLAAALVLASLGVGLAQTTDPNLPMPNGPVYAVVRDGGTIYIGGAFTQVGSFGASGWVPLDISSGSPNAPFPKVDGRVFAVVPDGAGGWYIGGAFSHVGEVARSNIAHIASDMSVSAWDPDAHGDPGGNFVSVLTIDGSTVYAGGRFTTIGGQARNNIAALDAGTGLATPWDPNASDNNVYGIVVSGSTVYVGGAFSTIGGQTRRKIAALDATTGLATSWNPDPNGGEVDLVVVSGSTIYACGDFSTIGGQARSHIAALDAATGNATAWDPSANGSVWALAVSDSTIYAGGDFTSIGGQARNRIAALGAGSGAATAWNPSADAYVRALAVDGSTVYAGGQFTTVGGQSRTRLAALDAVSGNATSWNPGHGDVLYAIAVSGSTVGVGGELTNVGGIMRNGIAALDAATGAVTAWNPDVDNNGDPNSFVDAIAVSGPTVYVGGLFSRVGGQTRNRIAAIDAASGAPTAWNPDAPGGGQVWALAVNGSTVYAGGSFTTVSGLARSGIAAIDAATGIPTSWNPSPGGGDVRALAVSGSTVYVGGSFTTIGGQSRNRIAALDAATGNATSWNPSADRYVFALALSGSIVYAGGDFTSIGGGARDRIAALDVTTGDATAWNPTTAGDPFGYCPGGICASVRALAVSGCTVYASGYFTGIGGQARNRIAALDASSGLATAWDPDANEWTLALAVSDSILYAGGGFTAIGGQTRNYFAAISTGPSIAAVQPASGGDDGVVTATIAGVNLASCTAVKLARSGQPDIVGTGVTAALGLSATFDLRGAASGLWDVVVTNPGSQTATLANGFTIEAIAAPQLRVDVIGPDAIRANYPNAFNLVVGNPGNVDALAVPLWITGIPADAAVALDSPLASPTQGSGEPDWGQVPDTLTSAGGRYLALVLPRVPPGSVTRRLLLTVPSSDSTIQLRAALTPPWADGAAFRACLSDNGVIQNPACMSAQLGAINAYLAGTPDIVALNGIGEWAKIGWQCEGAGTLTDAVAKARQVLDFMVQSVEQPGAAPAGCGEALRPRWRDSLVVHVVSSVDPNDKVGKHGVLSSGQAVPYAIHFENASQATTSAQQVIVSDPLPSSVDLNTVSLVAIIFGADSTGSPYRVLPPPGLSSGSWDVDLGKSRGLVVRVAAGFVPPAAITRRLQWSFTSLDRDSLLPLSPTSTRGFLPPNQTAHQGEGSVLFTVMPLVGLSTGTEIQNQGAITFDYNPTQNTPVWSNTVDNTPPASHVLPLGANQDSANFAVHWGVVGAAPDLKDFTIYAKEDAGVYHVWRLNTIATADTFAGRRGHSYAFYSQARDTIGNIEAAHGSPDAQTYSSVTVQGETSTRLMLAGALPNPAIGLVRAWFTLPNWAPATLELIDVAGRRVARREVGELGPGQHMAVLGSSPRLRPGLYFLRLAQGRLALKARVVVIR